MDPVTVLAAPQKVICMILNTITIRRQTETAFDFGHTMRRGIFITFFLFAGLLLAQKRPITLEAYEQYRTRPAAAPVPGEPVWAPDGKSFAYRLGDDLILFDGASHATRTLVHLSEMNAAVELPPPTEGDPWENRNIFTRQFTWSPAGDRILYASSGDLILIEVKTGKWRNLTKTPVAEADPKFSPDGSRIAFRRSWDLYTMDLKSGKETRLTANGSSVTRNAGLDWVYPEEIGLTTAYWWSPDSRSILYLQFNVAGEPQYPHAELLGEKAVSQLQRYPQAGDPNALVRPGIIAATGGTTKWLDVGDTVSGYLIARAGWTPDSRHVWIARTNRVQNQLAMLLFDASSGSSKTIYRETAPDWLNISGEPEFLPDSTAYFWTSEKDGFRHLYLFPVDGSKSKQISEGAWEISSISCWDFLHRQVYFTSSEADPLGRQLYRLNLDGSGKIRLTEAAGTHRISMAPGCQAYLDTYSSRTSPPETTLRSVDSPQATTFRPANRAVLDEFQFQMPELLSFDSAPSTGKAKAKLYGHLLKPPDFDPARKYPLIVDVYGGPHAQSVRDAWSGLTFDQVLAARGYLVWEMDNRGTSGRGHAFEVPVFHNLGQVELEDQRAGVEHLISLGFVDPARIGVHGWSYGGFMAANLLLNAPDLFRAAFAGAPVTDWRNYDTIYTERYMGLPSENENGYREASLVRQAGKLDGRLMIAHNIEDDNVLFQNTLQFTNALQSAGKQFEMQVYAGRGHSVSGASVRQMDAVMVEFFDRALASANAAENSR
jgi:dipeptidyl-peptidase 4